MEPAETVSPRPVPGLGQRSPGDWDKADFHFWRESKNDHGLVHPGGHPDRSGWDPNGFEITPFSESQQTEPVLVVAYHPVLATLFMLDLGSVHRTMVVRPKIRSGI